MAGATGNCCHLGAFCVHLTTMHHVGFMQSHLCKVHAYVAVTCHLHSCKATYVRWHAFVAVTCHLHFWQNDRVLLHAIAEGGGGGGGGVGTDTEIRASTESRPWRRKFSRRSSRDSNPRPFDHESGTLTTELVQSSKEPSSDFSF